MKLIYLMFLKKIKSILQNNCPYFKIKLDESQKLTDEEINF